MYEKKRNKRPGLAVLTWLRLARIFQKVDTASAVHLRQWGLSVAQFDILVQVGRHEGISQQELADALLVTKGNVCQLITRMEREGLLRRVQHGRANNLHLTEEGYRLFDVVVPSQEELIAQQFGGLSATELSQLRGLLRAVEASLPESR